MFDKWLRLYHTVRYIKNIQLFYQVWYRIKNRFISINWYNGNFDSQVKQVATGVDKILFVSKQEMLSEKKFRFLERTHTFHDTVNWNLLEHGKLWNYNLQYFSFLLDERVDNESRCRILKEFSSALLKKEVSLEPYPVSLRIVNSLLFNSRYPINDHVVLSVLLKQIEYLSKNLELHLLGNHLLENIFSLYIASIYLNNTQLHSLSYNLLVKELHEQILADGGHYECSPMYQSILLSKLFLCIELGRKSTITNKEELNFLEAKSAKMLGWINAYSFPDGTWALMNDAAEGIAPVTANLNKAAEFLQITPEVVYLAESGFRKITGTNWQLLIKTGRVQPAYQPGHVHADIMSFCLWHNGKQVVVDPGTSTYSISEQRNRERGTELHNTLFINGFNQSDMWGGFRVGKRATVFLKKDSSDQIEIHLKPFFDRRIIHTRRFTKINNRQFKIEDLIHSPAALKLTVSGGIQFGFEVQLKQADNGIQSDNMLLQLSGVDESKLVEGTYATTYNKLQYGYRLSYNMNTSACLTFSFI